MQESAEPITASDITDRWWCWRSRVGIWSAEVEAAMRPLGVVVVDIDAQDPFEVAAVEDQQPVETLVAHGSDEALGDRVRFSSSSTQAAASASPAAPPILTGTG
ncbi:MAG TPA: hypothetical protein VES62_04520 [Thermoleophilaceae bacterium]|nr:hypothetical protein [Thermoleophilaceae bacterium]